MGYGYCVSAACTNQVDASNLSNVVNLPSLFFSGFFSNNPSIPTKTVNWLQWINPVRYAFEALLRAEYNETWVLWRVPGSLGLKFGYWNCVIMLAVLAIVSRCISLLILRSNVKYIV